MGAGLAGARGRVQRTLRHHLPQPQGGDPLRLPGGLAAAEAIAVAAGKESLVTIENPTRAASVSLVRVLRGDKAVASELVFQGQLPGEPVKWRKAAIILAAGQEEKGFIMAYSAPLERLQEFRPAFRFVEASWRTIL